MTRVSKNLDAEQKTGYVEIHPRDAEKLALNLTVTYGQSYHPQRCNPGPGQNQQAGKTRSCFFVPFHFSENPANALTNSAFDPIAKIPEFKVCAVKIEKAA